MKRIIVLATLLIVNVAAAQELPNRAPGFAADKVYQFGDVDSINLFNGNLTIPIPLGQTYQVSDNLSYGFKLVYNGNVWEYANHCHDEIGSDGTTHPVCNGAGFPSLLSNAGIGFAITLGELLEPGKPLNYAKDSPGWLYVDPEGARTSITSTGSAGSLFARMRDAGAGVREVDFPNGQTRRFELAGSDWRLVEIRDRSSVISNGRATTNYVHVDYTTWDNAGVQDPEVDYTDSYGRIQRIRYIPGFVDPKLPASVDGMFSDDGAAPNYFQYPPPLRGTVKYVDLIGADGTAEHYTFDYDVELNGVRGYDHYDTLIPADTEFRRLRTLTLPDGSQYSFDYDNRGSLTSLTLPTGGRITYDYDLRIFPNFPPICREGKVDHPPPPAASVFVKTRTLYDTVPGSAPAIWSYKQDYDGGYQCFYSGDGTCGLMGCPPLEMKVTVTDPLLNRTESYYSMAVSSTYPRIVNGQQGAMPYSEGWRDGQYGLPFTLLHQTDDHSRYLSTRVYDASGRILRSTYVVYDSDDPDFANRPKDLESKRPRVSATRTVYDDDTSCGGQPCYVDVENVKSTYDGFGHYRDTITTTNFGPRQETVRDYNSSPSPTDRLGMRGGVFAIGIDQPWIINRFSQETRSQTTTDGTQTAYKQFCFDANTGSLLRTRTMAGATVSGADLVTAIEYDTHGNVQRESYYGGDAAAAPTDFCGFDPTQTTPQYAIGHEAPAGIETRSYYLTPGTSDKLLSTYDADLYPGGPPKDSRDAAGLVTHYDYTSMWRIHEIHPPGSAWTEYVYQKAGDPGYPFATVIARQHSLGANDVLTEVQYEFDGFGRLYQETTTMPGGVGSVRRTTYNPNGWKYRVSERGTDPTLHYTEYSYDPLGRALSIKAPDGKVISFAYFGTKTVERSVGLGLDSGEAPVKTIETYDAYGRLAQVREYSGVESNPLETATDAEHDTRVATDYKYDVNDHLTRVDSTDKTAPARPSQYRTFTYDLRGFLTQEYNPEKGTTTYPNYDARGHVQRKQDGSDPDFDLTFAYDRAERLTTVSLTSTSDEIKHFYFDDHNGRLNSATRHNRQVDVGDVSVTDSYTYELATGRVSKKDTSLSIKKGQSITLGQTFTQSFNYTDLNAPRELHFPTCFSCPAGTKPDRTIPVGYSFGLVTGVQGFTTDNGITYWPNGLVHTIVHASNNNAHNITDTQEADSSGMARPASIDFTGVCAGPTLSSPTPQTTTVLAGQPADFNIDPPIGVTTPLYQWYQGPRGDTTHKVDGATSTHLHIASVTQNSTYWVRVTNDGGCWTDSTTVTANIRVCDPTALSITTQPKSAVTPIGGAVTLSVVANGAASYQWYEGLSGTTAKLVSTDGATFRVTGVTASTSYWVRVLSADGCAVDSTTALVTICTAPRIETQPQSASQYTSSTDSIKLTSTVVATGYNLQYEWHELITSGGVESEDTQHIAGSSATLEVNLTAPSEKRYVVHVKSSAVEGCSGDVTSAPVTLSVVPLQSCITLDTDLGGYFVSTPVYNATLLGVGVHGAVIPGQTATFTFDWYHGVDGQVIKYGVTTQQTVTNGVTSTQFLIGPSGDYDAVWCVVTRTDGNCNGSSVTTGKVYMKRWDACPLPPVRVTTEYPDGTTQPPTFRANVDWPRVTYQWYYGASGDTSHPIPNSTQSTMRPAEVVSTAYWVRVTNECGNSEDSTTVSYVVSGCDPVRITQQPHNVDTVSGGSPTLSVFAPNGTAYQWIKQDTGEVAGTSATVTLDGKYTKKTATFVAVVGNSCTSTYSAAAIVRVKSCGAFSITTQPQSQTIVNGVGSQTVTLSVAASQVPESYQWYQGESGDSGYPVVNATGPSLQVSVTASAKYWVRLKAGDCEIDSDTAVLTWCDPPHLIANGSTTSIRLGQVAFLQAAAEGTGLQYAWYKNVVVEPPLSTNPWYYEYPSATTTYILKVTGQCGTPVTASYVYQVCQGPSISQQPQSVTVFPGKTATLHITANEGPSTQITYQWLDENGAGVKSETLDSGVMSSFTTPPITDTKKYSVHLVTGACAADSDQATVSLCTLPEVIGGAAAYYVAPGQLVTLHASATTGDNTFQWYSGAVGDTTHPITDAINSSYAFVPPSTGGLYWCSVTHADDGCVSHTGVNTVNVCVPVISQQPANALRIPGSSVTLSVTASPASAYQWYIGQKDDITNPVAGATTASINVSPTTDTSYWVRVIGTCGKDDRGGDIAVTDSESALVTVCQPPSFQQAIPGTWWVARGASWTLGVVANGTSLTYQWYTGNSGDTSAPIANATGANLTVTPQNTTSYWVRVSGSCAPPANGPTMTVAVCMTPSITTQPQGVSIFSGSTTTLSVTATEATTSAMTYQWYRGLSGDDSVPISGATASTFTTPALTADTNYWVRVSCGSCPPANSQTAAVTMCLYPQTISPPPDVQIGAGDLTRLTGVTQSQSGNSYKWYRGASGNTSSPISDWSPIIYYDVNPTVTTQYWYQLQNGSCTSNSGTVTVNVCIPRITTQPNSIIINSGSPTTLSVAATPTTNTYQWYVGTSGTTTSPISGATSSSLTVTPSSTTNYWVRITSACGRTLDSNTATVTICQLPAIQSAGPTGSDPHGTPYTLIVNATGTNITYQWYTGSTGNTAAPIAGATSSTLVVTPADTTNYWVRVSGACNPPKDSGTITVSVCGTPGINTQPQSVYIFSGASTTLSVSAGEGYNTPMTYQWYRGASGDPSNPIAGATSTTYTTPALTADTSYWVKVSAGSCNPANSQTAVVSMCANPQIVTSSGDVQTTYLQSTRLYAYGNGTGNSYTWYIGAAGDTSHPYYSSANNYMDVAPGTTTQYWAQVVNGTCTSRTNTLTVSVCVPTFTTQPQSITIPQGSPTTLTSAANTAGVTYQWYVGASGTTSSPISGATSSNLTVTPSATTNYWVRAIGSCGRTADSATATVTMCAPPAITTQPTDGPATAPNYWMSKSVQATGPGLTYQWYQGDSGDTHAPLSDSSRDYQATGTATATLNLYVQGAMKVWVRVTGQCGAINSNAVWFNVIPTLYQPQSRTVSSGSSGSLMVGASAGTSVISYQWYNGATNAPIGGNSNIVTFTNITSAVSAYCKVMTGDIYVWSYSASIDVCHGPSVTLSQTVSGTYRYIYATVNGDYSAIEWYQGPVGQTNGSTYLQSGGNALWIPYSPGTIWCRVYGTDIYSGSECDADASVTLTP